MMYNCNNHKTIFSHNKGVPVANSIHHSNSIYNYFKSLKLGLFLSDVYLNHLMIIMVSVFLRGYRGKTIDFAEVSCMHRTTTAYFLNHGKWDDSALQDILKARVIHTKHIAPESPFSVLWMILLLHTQSLRHRLCIQLKQRISINLT